MPGANGRKLSPVEEVSDAGAPHEHAIRAVREALGRVRFGSILITIHEGDVVGIETSTKVRLKNPRSGSRQELFRSTTPPEIERPAGPFDRKETK